MLNGVECYRRYLNGDEKAFDELIDAYHDGLILFINKIIGNYSVSEEIAADCFVELIIHKKRFLGTSDFRTYLYSIGRHKAIDYVRKDAKKKIITPEDMPEIAEDALLEDLYIQDETKRALHNAILQLGKDYREVVYLVFFEELSYEETAKVLRKNKKQIDNLVYRAKGALKKILTKEGSYFEK